MAQKKNTVKAIDSKEMAVVLSQLSYEIDKDSQEFVLTYAWENPDKKTQGWIDRNHGLLKSNERLEKLCKCWFRAYEKSNSTKAIFGGLIPILIKEGFITENYIKTSY